MKRFNLSEQATSLQISKAKEILDSATKEGIKDEDKLIEVCASILRLRDVVNQLAPSIARAEDILEKRMKKDGQEIVFSANFKRKEKSLDDKGNPIDLIKMFEIKDEYRLQNVTKDIFDSEGAKTQMGIKIADDPSDPCVKKVSVLDEKDWDKIKELSVQFKPTTTEQLKQDKGYTKYWSKQTSQKYEYSSKEFEISDENKNK